MPEAELHLFPSNYLLLTPLTTPLVLSPRNVVLPATLTQSLGAVSILLSHLLLRSCNSLNSRAAPKGISCTCSFWFHLHSSCWEIFTPFWLDCCSRFCLLPSYEPLTVSDKSQRGVLCDPAQHKLFGSQITFRRQFFFHCGISYCRLPPSSYAHLSRHSHC